MGFKGDFLGFTFDGIHSSELGIVRTSESNRYTDNLLPTMADKTVQVPGADGTFYYDSFYTQRPFTIQIAYDDLNDTQLRRLRQIFGDKKIHKLIFDEFPYKYYKVKATGTPSLKYISFDVQNEDSDDVIEDFYAPSPADVSLGRVYKGEGTLTFTALYPFAMSTYKYYDNFFEEGAMAQWENTDIYDQSFNMEKWRESVDLKDSYTYAEKNGVEYFLDQPQEKGVMVYNPGDFPTDFTLWFEGGTGTKISYSNNYQIVIEDIALAQGDAGFIYDSKLNAILGVNGEGNQTGNIYNRYITKGDFFKLPVTEIDSQSGERELQLLSTDRKAKEIKYNYLYF